MKPAASPFFALLSRPWARPTLMAAALLLLALTALTAPLEATLGAGARLIYFHGAWVWAGLLLFAAAALTGLVGLIAGRGWPAWSLALGRAALIFWLTYLPVSLLVMQVSWGGFFFDEPRWRIPFTFAVVGALLQAGLALLPAPRLACLGNLGFGAALWFSLARAETILHPDSPIFQGGSARIQVFFVALVALSLAFGALLAGGLRPRAGQVSP